LNHTGTELQYNGSGTGNYYDSNDCFEPRDSIKGDVARILMYVFTHYGTEFGGQTNDYTGDLPITNIFYTATGTAQAAWNQLMDWSADDPVDSFEMARNNQAAVYQGNRNPFIDHPEYANRIWGTAVTSFTMPSSLAVTVGGTGSAAGAVTGSGTVTSVKYEITSGSSYASVNSSTGVVTGTDPGDAVVTGTAVIDETTYTDTTNVTVSTLSVSSVTISPKPLTLTVGGTSTLTATVLPSSVSQGVTWSSSDTSIVTVSSTGVVTAVAAGSATITATSTLDATKKDTCTVTVNAAATSGEFQLCTSASDLVAGTDYVIGSAGATSGYFMTTTPASSSSYYLPGESLTITSALRVTPSATTMIFTLGGSSSGYSFYTTNCTTSQGYLDGGSTDTSAYLTVTAATAGSTAGSTELWTVAISSSDSSAVVTNTGKDTYNLLEWNPQAPRFSTYATTSTLEKPVYLYKRAAAVAVTSVTLSPTTLALKVGQTSTLTATVLPSNATNKAVTWSSSNTAIATVANGVVTAVAAGSATITVTTADGGHTATCVVTVTNVKTVLSISASNAPDLPFGSNTYTPTSSTNFVVTAYWNDNTNSNVTATATYPTLATFITTYHKVLGLHDLAVSYTDEQSVTVTTTVSVRTTNVGAVRTGGSAPTTTTVTSATAASGAITDWTGSGIGTAYKDGSVKFDTTGDYYENLSFFGSSDITEVTQIVFTIKLKQNGGTASSTANVFTVNFTDASGNTVFSKVLTGGTTTDDNGAVVFNTTATSHPFTMSGLTSSAIRGVKLVYTTKNTGNIGLYSFSATVTHGSGTTTYFTYQEQAEAMRNYLDLVRTCEVSNVQAARFALEYNAMKTDATENSKTIFATLMTTGKQYVYGTDYTTEGGYSTNSPSGVVMNAYDRLVYIIARYNYENPSSLITLYTSATYEGTGAGGTGTTVVPHLIDAAGHIINPTSTQNTLSTTLIVVASSGVFTLLMVAGIFLLSKKKKHA
jgi:uncharacterized protein YjdB